MDEPPTWVSRRAAARILACAERTVDAMITRGDLRVDRPGNHHLPSLLRADVEDLAARRAARRADLDQARRERDEERARAAARRVDPDDGDWISTHEAAHILGVTRGWVKILASQGHLPAVKRGDGAYRYRRRQIIVISNAWRVAAAIRNAPRTDGR